MLSGYRLDVMTEGDMGEEVCEEKVEKDGMQIGDERKKTGIMGTGGEEIKVQGN